MPAHVKLEVEVTSVVILAAKVVRMCECVTYLDKIFDITQRYFLFDFL